MLRENQTDSCKAFADISSDLRLYRPMLHRRQIRTLRVCSNGNAECPNQRACKQTCHNYSSEVTFCAEEKKQLANMQNARNQVLAPPAHDSRS